MTIKDQYPIADQERWIDCEAYVLAASDLRSRIALVRDAASAVSSLDAAAPTTRLGSQIASLRVLADKAEAELAEIPASCRRERRPH